MSRAREAPEHALSPSGEVDNAGAAAAHDFSLVGKLEQASSSPAAEHNASASCASLTTRQLEARSEHRASTGRTDRHERAQAHRRSMRAAAQSERRVDARQQVGVTVGRPEHGRGPARSSQVGRSAEHAVPPSCIDSAGGAGGTANSAFLPDGTTTGTAEQFAAGEMAPAMGSDSARACAEECAAWRGDARAAEAGAGEAATQNWSVIARTGAEEGAVLRGDARAAQSAAGETVAGITSDGVRGRGEKTAAWQNNARALQPTPRATVAGTASVGARSDSPGSTPLSSRNAQQGTIASGAHRVQQVLKIATCAAEKLKDSVVFPETTDFAMISALQAIESGGVGTLGVLCSRDSVVREVADFLASIFSTRCSSIFVDLASVKRKSKNFEVSGDMLLAGEMGTCETPDDTHCAGASASSFPSGIVFAYGLSRLHASWRKTFFAELKQKRFLSEKLAPGTLFVLLVEPLHKRNEHAWKTAPVEREGLARNLERAQACVSAFVRALPASREEKLSAKDTLHSALVWKPQTLSASDVAECLDALGFVLESNIAEDVARVVSTLSAEKAVSLLRATAIFLRRAPTTNEVQNAVEQSIPKGGRDALCDTPEEEANTEEQCSSKVQGSGKHRAFREEPDAAHSSDQILCFPRSRVKGVTLSRSFPAEGFKCRFEVLVPGEGFGYCRNKSECNSHSIVDRQLNNLVIMTPDERRERMRALEDLAQEGQMLGNNRRLPFCIPANLSETTPSVVARITHPCFILQIVQIMIVKRCRTLEQLRRCVSTWGSLLRLMGKKVEHLWSTQGVLLGTLGLRPFYDVSEFSNAVESVMRSLLSDDRSSSVQALRRVIGARNVRAFAAKHQIFMSRAEARGEVPKVLVGPSASSSIPSNENGELQRATGDPEDTNEYENRDLVYQHNIESGVAVPMGLVPALEISGGGVHAHAQRGDSHEPVCADAHDKGLGASQRRGVIEDERK